MTVGGGKTILSCFKEVFLLSKLKIDRKIEESYTVINRFEKYE